MTRQHALDPPRPPARHHRGHGSAAEAQEAEPRARLRLVELWADLLTTLQQDPSSVVTSLDEMAEDIPRDLVAPVNRELRQRGSSFQVSRRRLRRAAAPRPVCSPSPASDGADPRPCG